MFPSTRLHAERDFSRAAQLVLAREKDARNHFGMSGAEVILLRTRMERREDVYRKLLWACYYSFWKWEILFGQPMHVHLYGEMRMQGVVDQKFPISYVHGQNVHEITHIDLCDKLQLKKIESSWGCTVDLCYG